LARSPALTLEIVAAHTGGRSEDGRYALNRSATPHLAPDRLGDPLHLARDPDPVPMWMVVAAIAVVDVDAANLHAGELLEIGDHRASVWPSNGLPCSALACSTNRPPFGDRDQRRNRDLAAELVGRMGLAAANAFHFRGLQRITFGLCAPGDTPEARDLA
jgi:hypothetical protein